MGETEGGGSDPTDPCPTQPVEPGDGVVTEPAAEPDAPVSNEDPGVIVDPGVICAFGVPVSAPVADGAPEAAAGGGAVTAVDAAAPEVAAQLPRTGPKERLMALGGFGAVLLGLGAWALAAGRRRAEA